MLMVVKQLLVKPEMEEAAGEAVAGEEKLSVSSDPKFELLCADPLRV